MRVVVMTVLGMVPLRTDPALLAVAVPNMFGLAFAALLPMIVVPLLCRMMYRIKPE